MSEKITAAQAVSETQLVVWLDDGETLLFDVLDTCGTTLSEGPLHVLAKGQEIVSGDTHVASFDEVLEVGVPLDIVASECKRVIADIVDARRAQGFSQAKLASAAGVKQPVIARLETGVNSPRLDTMLKVLTPLGKTLAIGDLKDTCDIADAVEAAC